MNQDFRQQLYNDWMFTMTEIELFFPFRKPFRPQAINMDIFTACEVFFTFLEAKPCHVR